jgi:hypothetical protein
LATACMPARHVLGEKSARNRFGRLWKESFISGTVQGVVTARVNVREQVSVDVLWDVGEGTKRKTVKTINIRIGDAPGHSELPCEESGQSQAFEVALPTEEGEVGRHERESTVSYPPTPEIEPSLPCTGSALDVHGYHWKREDVQAPIGGPLRRRQWMLTVPGGRDITQNGDFLNERPIIEYFLALLPIAHLNVMVELTNENLLKAKQRLTRPSEILRFFGLMILMTRFKFGKRESLWSSTQVSKFIPSPDFGITGITRARFRELRFAIRFSEQGDNTEMSSSLHRWSLVQGFVNAINSHRKERFNPSEMICVDESISRWYGLGGSWIDVGLPHYVAIDRKPENGCELQNSACGQSGVTLRLKLVVAAEDDAAAITEDADMLHGTRVLAELVSPWAGSSRVVCADSYFSSVQAAEQLLSMGLKFIGIVKTATKQFPMQALGSIEMEMRGERDTYVNKTEDGRVRMMAMVWLDRERRYFIS